MCSLSTISDVYPTLLQRLALYSSSPLLKPSDLQLGAVLCNLLISVVHVAAITPSMLVMPDGDAHPPLSINWAHAKGIIGPALLSLTRVINEGVEATVSDIVNVAVVAYVVFTLA